MPKAAPYKGEIDLSSAVPAEGVTTVRQGADLSAYENLLTSSWNARTTDSEGKERGQVMQLRLAEAAVKTVENRLRQAAKTLELGVATGSLPSGDEGFVLLRVQANPKKVTAPKAAGTRKAGAGKGLPPVAKAS